ELHRVGGRGDVDGPHPPDAVLRHREAGAELRCRLTDRRWPVPPWPGLVGLVELAEGLQPDLLGTLDRRHLQPPRSLGWEVTRAASSSSSARRRSRRTCASSASWRLRRSACRPLAGSPMPRATIQRTLTPRAAPAGRRTGTPPAAPPARRSRRPPLA